MDAPKNNQSNQNRQMMDFAPRKVASHDTNVVPRVSQKELARREMARQTEERREAIHRQIVEQKREALERAARARAAREELDERNAAEAIRQHQLEVARRREQERRRQEEERERNLEYEENVRKTQAAIKLAEKGAEEREQEALARKREYQELLKRQQAAEAHRQAMKRREDEARARAKRFKEEKRIREEAALREAEEKERIALAKARIEGKPLEPAKPANNQIRYVSGFPRRHPGDPAHIVAPGNLMTHRPAGPIDIKPQDDKPPVKPEVENTVTDEEFESEGLDSTKLGSLDDFEADLMNLEAASENESANYDEPVPAADDEDDLDRAISSLDEDDELLSDKVSSNNSRYIYGGKSPFINTDKIEKRPLSSITRELAAQDEMPHKNIYARRVAAVEKGKDKDVPTMVVDNDKAKGSGVSLAIAITLTVILGAIVGTIAYLAIFQ